MCASEAATSTIIRTDQIKPIQNEIAQSGPGTLIVFDVASVLMKPKDSVFDSQNKWYFKEVFGQDVDKSAEGPGADLPSTIVRTRQDEPVDLQMPITIKEAQNRGLKALGLTSSYTGSFGTIEKLEDLRITKLKKLGYDFHASWPHLESKIFNQFTPKKPKRIPAYKEGIVFVCRHNKGDLLKAFLDYSGYKPTKIIFVDNKLRNIKDVAAYARSVNIPYVGFEYVAVAERASKPLNKERVRYQAKVLSQEKRWISDEEADQRMKLGQAKAA